MKDQTEYWKRNDKSSYYEQVSDNRGAVGSVMGMSCMMQYDDSRYGEDWELHVTLDFLCTVEPHY